MRASDKGSLPGRTAARAVMVGSVVNGLQRFTQCPNGEWRKLLAAVGLTPEDLTNGDALIPLDRGFAAFEAVAAWAGEPALGVDFAQSFEVGGTGPLGFAIVNARDVGEALRIASRFIPLVNSMRECRYEVDDVAGRIVWRYPGEDKSPRLQFVTFGVAAIIQRIATALPKGWRPHAVDLDFDAPAQRQTLDTYFGPGLNFQRGLGHFAFAVQAEHLDRPMPSASPRLFELVTRLAEIEQHKRGTYASVFEGEARQALAQMLKRGQSTASALAEALGLTAAELRAAFRQHDLDFRSLINEIRREQARSYLAETSLSIAEIAFALGYSDTSIFTRACHKWFGQSPRDVRDQAVAR